MPKYTPCDCGQPGCFECAVGLVIAELGFPLHCNCFSDARRPSCKNKCNRMHLDWRSAFDRCSPPYTEWARRRLSQYGQVVARASPIKNGVEQDVTELVRGGQEIGTDESFFVSTRRDLETAAKRLADEVNSDPVSFEAGKQLIATCIRERVEIPESLRDWAVGMVLGVNARPIAKGKVKGATLARDKLIYRLVQDVVKFAVLLPTAGDRTDGRSACHAVAEGFRLLGLQPQSYETIVKIQQNPKAYGEFFSSED